MSSITKEHAVEIALKALAATGPASHELVLLEDEPIEHEFGWVFHANSRRYRETRDFMHMIPGIGPLVVDRVDGKAEFLPTSLPPHLALAEYERRWRQRRKPAGSA